MEKIAILGGTPIRVEPLSYGKQYIDEADIEAVTKVLKSPFLTCGPKVPEQRRNYVKLQVPNMLSQCQMVQLLLMLPVLLLE